MSDLIEVWRSIIVGSDKSWVLFSHGTCVILPEPQEDLAQQAITLMKEWGPVHAGSSAGDFSIITLNDEKGWAVTCHHPDILTYVSPEESSSDDNDFVIGMMGRSKRDQDAGKLSVLHIEDKRRSE